MQTNRQNSRFIGCLREEEEEVGSCGKSAEIAQDGLTIPPIIEGEVRNPPGNSPLILSPCGEETEFDEKLAEDFMRGLKLESMLQEHDEENEEEQGGGEECGEDDERDEEFEFAFVCADPDGSLISAEEAFQNGQIRPFYPVFGRNILLDEDVSQSTSSSSSSSMLKGILAEERMGNPSSSSSSDGGDPLEGLAEGTYCVWRKGRAAEAGEGGEGACKKSNSTGFSRLWRVKDLVMRSNSDGKDVFVFLNPKKAKENATTPMTTTAAAETKSVAKSNGSKAKAATVAVRKGGHSLKHPGRSDNNRRRSYLPYRVGFFTNINGMSRNLHPY